MADVKISELPSASVPLAGTELIPIVQGGETRKVPLGSVAAYSFYQGFVATADQTAFTLSRDGLTTNGSIVAVNGVIQRPTTDYSISGTTLTFVNGVTVGYAVSVRAGLPTAGSGGSGNAGSISYNDLSDKPEFGSAAFANTGDFMASGGTAADSAKLNNQTGSYYLALENSTGTLAEGKLPVLGIRFSIQGKTTSTEGYIPLGLARVSFTPNPQNCRAIADVAATSTTVFTFHSGTNNIGTLTFWAGSSIGVFTFTGDIIGDLSFYVVPPTTPDATLSNINVRIGPLIDQVAGGGGPIMGGEPIGGGV